MNNYSNLTTLKKDVLMRIVKAFDSGNFEQAVNQIPTEMRPDGTEAPFRTDIATERAALKDMIIAALGFSLENADDTKTLADYAKAALAREKVEEEYPLTVSKVSCHGCESNQIRVTDMCQGCVARPCQSACRFGAIAMQNGKSVIDNAKCKKCTLCLQSCPYQAIAKLTPPCEAVCPVGAITKNEKGETIINFDKCISCGKCMEACPFGAVQEKTQIIDILNNIKAGKKVIAMVAPSIAGQFDANIYQVKTALLKAGFTDVVEVAQGADTTTRNEAAEFKERMEEGANFMTTSCCAAYNNLIEKHLPEIKPFVSTTGTPLYYTAQIVKGEHLGCVSVFLSPCVSKKVEGYKNPNVDYVLSYCELDAILAAKGIDVTTCEETAFAVSASKQSRNFGVTTGVGAAVSFLAEGVKPYVISGLTKEAVRDLRKFAKTGVCEGCNLIEVMSCAGGCVGGTECIKNMKLSCKKIDELLQQSEDIKA